MYYSPRINCFVHHIIWGENSPSPQCSVDPRHVSKSLPSASMMIKNGIGCDEVIRHETFFVIPLLYFFGQNFVFLAFFFHKFSFSFSFFFSRLESFSCAGYRLSTQWNGDTLSCTISVFSLGLVVMDHTTFFLIKI